MYYKIKQLQIRHYIIKNIVVNRILLLFSVVGVFFRNICTQQLYADRAQIVWPS